MKNNINDAKHITSKSIFIADLKGTGRITAVIASTKNTLNMLEPTTLPTAISAFPFFAATADVNSSGREVPSATTVNPITLSLIPILTAIFTALSTTSFPPINSPISPDEITRLYVAGKLQPGDNVCDH